MFKKHSKLVTTLIIFALIFSVPVTAISNNGEVIDMANKYCNIDGTETISESYTEINTGFDKVETDMTKNNNDIIALDTRVDNIIATPVEGVSAQEIIDARNGEVVLGNRLNGLDSQLADYTTQLNILATGKADKTYVDNNISVLDTKINSQASGSPKGVYATVSALTTAFPTGNTNIYLVTSDGKWYYWNGTVWTAGGTYQGIVIADKTIAANMLKSDYNYRGFYHGDTNDANNLLDEGRYYVASTVLNLPKRNYFGTESVAVILEVERYNTRIIQKARPINYPDEVYYRYTDSTFAGVKWKLLQRVIKPLNGKKVILMGDSLTDKGKQHLTIWERTGAEVDKIGIGGTTMSNHGNSEDYSKLSFYSLAKAIGTGNFTEQETAVANIYNSSGGATNLNPWLIKFKAIDWNAIDYILVRYGTNDHAMDNPIGAIDRTNLDTTTYIGAFNQGIKDILTTYPRIRIFVATPLWRYSPNIGTGGDSDTTPNNNGDFIVEFVDALGVVAGLNHLPFYDYYRRSGINTYTNTHYLSDQTHLNDAGSILIGEIDSNFLTSN